MKVPDITIEKSASKEKNRYTFNAVLYDPENKRMAATNGSILAVIPFEPEPEEETRKTIIPVAAITAARKNKINPRIQLESEKVIVDVAGASMSFPVRAGQFPNIDAIIPAEIPELTICLDAAALLQLAQSLQERNHNGAYFVSLHVKDKSSVVHVKPANGCAPSGAFGLIMPGGEKR